MDDKTAQRGDQQLSEEYKSENKSEVTPKREKELTKKTKAVN